MSRKRKPTSTPFKFMCELKELKKQLQKVQTVITENKSNGRFVPRQQKYGQLEGQQHQRSLSSEMISDVCNLVIGCGEHEEDMRVEPMKQLNSISEADLEDTMPLANLLPNL